MFDTLIGRLKQWALIQEGIERLRQLDDRQLADMGIERDMIAEIAQSGRIVTRATLAEEAERQAAAPATPAVSHARPPSLARRGENCGSVPSMS